MRKLLITGLAMVLSSGALLAQYDDDAYSPSNDRNNTMRTERDYDQRDYNQDRYNEYDENDGYIDYDDDSYTARFRRFNSVYMGYNYWSPAYSPYWANPFYMDPFYYCAYRPGFSFNMGYGYGGPYWSSGWGWNNWWGYNGFGYWNSPYAMGWGGYYPYGYYGGGYWNGYYGGNRWEGNAWSRRNTNYGPRSNYGSLRTTSNGVRPAPGGTNYIRRAPAYNNSSSNSRITRGGTRIYNGNATTTPGRSIMRNDRQSSRPVRTREVTPDRMSAPRNNYNNNNNSNNRMDRTNTVQPSRNYSPAPSRNFGGGSRGGGFNSGGGSRGGGGGYRR